MSPTFRPASWGITRSIIAGLFAGLLPAAIAPRRRGRGALASPDKRDGQLHGSRRHHLGGTELHDHARILCPQLGCGETEGAANLRRSGRLHKWNGRLTQPSCGSRCHGGSVHHNGPFRFRTFRLLHLYGGRHEYASLSVVYSRR